jgi:predicted RecB family nuclease
MTDISVIEGIAEGFKSKLSAEGVTTVEALLERGATPKGRDELAEKTGISSKQVMRWVNHADLFRIKGVAGEMSELLEAAGVDTVAELAQRVPANLHAKMREVNETKKLVRQPPSESQVAAWVAEAKSLPRAVSY